MISFSTSLQYYIWKQKIGLGLWLVLLLGPWSFAKEEGGEMSSWGSDREHETVVMEFAWLLWWLELHAGQHTTCLITCPFRELTPLRLANVSCGERPGAGTVHFFLAAGKKKKSLFGFVFSSFFLELIKVASCL